MIEPWAPLYYHPRMLNYDFGPQHPLRPERLKRTVQLLEHYGVPILDPGLGEVADVLRVHDADYVNAVTFGGQPNAIIDPNEFGFGRGDNPSFPGMHEASLAYVAGSAAAARDVVSGKMLAFGLAGGLHHARKRMASGFCIYNDCAVAISILRERFARVTYVDIDVHHGCGVQWLFYDDPAVLTCSIHQDGRTLYPGSGSVEETGNTPGISAVNVPLAPGTDPEPWLRAFREVILPALTDFKPEAIVLQMGTDSHATDPLAQINNNVAHWLAAIQDVRDLGLPIVALGGGGYDLRNVPRMWVAATLLLNGREVPETIPEPFATEWGVRTFLE